MNSRQLQFVLAISKTSLYRAVGMNVLCIAKAIPISAGTTAGYTFHGVGGTNLGLQTVQESQLA